MSLTIVTNHVPRDVIDAWELTPAEREEFDYLDWPKIEAGEDSASFVRYKGDLIDLGDLECAAPTNNPFPRWDAYRSETFFSGLLFRYVENYERVIVGRYYS